MYLKFFIYANLECLVFKKIKYIQKNISSIYKNKNEKKKLFY